MSSKKFLSCPFCTKFRTLIWDDVKTIYSFLSFCQVKKRTNCCGNFFNEVTQPFLSLRFASK